MAPWRHKTHAITIQNKNWYCGRQIANSTMQKKSKGGWPKAQEKENRATFTSVE